MQEVTLYGSSTDSPAKAAAVLLAKARTYVKDTPTNSLNQLKTSSLAAAAILADLWCYENNTNQLQQPSQYGENATKILTAVYLRVLNNPTEGELLELHKSIPPVKSISDHQIQKIQEYQNWIEKWNLSQDVLQQVANDLSIASPDSIYASYAIAISDIITIS